MVDVAISVAAKVAEYLVDPLLRPAIRRARFLFLAGKIKTKLESTKMELTSKQESMMKKKEEALIRTEIIDEAVEVWLQKVSSIMEEVEQLEKEMKEDSSCCWGWCSTLKGCNLCKQFEEKTESMKCLNQVGEFNPFSRRAPIPDMEYFSSGNFVYFESTKWASKQLLEALGEDSVYMAGLYGMGGCGKTTLVKEVGKKAKELKLFHRVIFTTVSQSINVRQLQGEIADLLSFKLESETEAGRARELSRRLESGEQILIILDDVWAKLKLEDIGIPLRNNHKGCKVLLTTRRQQVCVSMDCERRIPLNLLSDEEAWNLFQKNTDIVDESVAQEVVRECKGLPIAIVAIAKSLKGRPLDGWNVALHKLRTSKPIDVNEEEINVYSCLELSYNYLRRKEAKLLLKICSMFPEDHEIPLEELFRYGIGLGICEEVDSFEVARSIVNDAIYDLIDSSLLLPCDNSDNETYVKIHDMVRDATLWISSKEDGTIMVDPERDFSAIVENGSIKDCYAFSLWYKEIDLIPQSLVAPKLQVLLLNSHYHLNLSDASIEGMKELKLFSMSHDRSSMSHHRSLLSLPTSILPFNNLHTLRLVNQDIDDISFILSLRRLKILDLHGSEFKKLPDGIENMNELKLLDLSNCGIREFYFEVIGGCSQLAELYLTSLIALPYECFLHKTFPKLQMYRLDICRNDFKWHPVYGRYVRYFRDVRFGGLNICNSYATIKDLLERAVSVCLDGLVGGSKSIIPEFVAAAGTINQLTKLRLISCSEIACIIDTTNSFQVNADLPKLVDLRLDGMDNLTEVVHGPLFPLCVFEKLEYLEIETCPKLRSLFQLSVAQSLVLLKELSIESCRKLKHIIMKGETEKNEVDTVEKETFPSLKVIKIISCGELEYIFPIFACGTLSSLQKIIIEDCGQLKHIIMNREGATTHSCPILKLPKLTDIYVNRCNRLECIFSGKYELRNLMSLKIGNCEKLTSLFSLFAAQSLLQLEILMLVGCMEFKNIIAKEVKNETDVAEKEIFPNLKTIEISFCDELECLFPILGAKTLPSLHSLAITECKQLKHILIKGETETTETDIVEKEIFPNLKTIKISFCDELECLFPNLGAKTLPSLYSLSIKKCRQLKQVIINEGEDAGHNSYFLIFPQLKEISVRDCDKLEFNLENLKQRQTSSNMGSDVLVANANRPTDEVLSHHIPKLEKLLFENLSALSFIWMGPPQCLKLQYLHDMEINGCGKLKSIFPSAIHNSFPELIRLEISDCEDLEEIMTKNEKSHNLSGSQPCFPKLRSLKVTKCNKLKSFFTLSIASELSQLEKLMISEAAQLEQAFTCKNEDVTGNGENFMLPNLRDLSLVNLPNFVNICFGLKLHAVKLQGMVVCKCPKFEIHQGSTEVLNNSPNLEALYLKDLPDLVFMWKAPTLIKFQNLVLLEVVACRKLKFIFPAYAVRSLPKLKYLAIRDCEELEQVFDDANEIHDYDGEVIELALPKLRALALIRLPNFKGFDADFQFQLKFHALKRYKVQDCPKFSSTIIAALENFLPGHEDHYSDNNDSDSDYDSDFSSLITSNSDEESDDASCKDESDDTNSHETNSDEESHDTNP